jgi:protein CpxP
LGTLNRELLNMKLPLVGGLVLAASVACLSTLAIAQDHPGATPPTPEQQQAWKQHREQRMQEMVEMRAHRIHDVLNLRPDQDAALKTLLTSMAPMHREHGPGDDKGRHGPEDMGKLTTPQRLDKMAARMAEHQAQFQQRAAAIKTFYAGLSPEQQRTFDAVPGLIGGEHHMGHDGDMGHHGHMGPGGPEGPGGPRGPQ